MSAKARVRWVVLLWLIGMGYAVLTGILGSVFVATIIGVQALLSTVAQSPTIAVAASTLVAFALFQPLRRAIQGAVDRRFDRARVDGERTAAEFRERLRHEVEITTVAAERLSTIDDSVKPASRGLWLRGGAG